MAPFRPLVRLLPIGWVPINLLARLAFGPFATPDLRTRLADVLSSLPPPVLKTRLRAVLEVDVSARLARVNVPVLCLRASQDRLVPRSASAAFSAVRRIRFEEIAGPHFLLHASPSAAAAHVGVFLRETGGKCQQ